MQSGGNAKPEGKHRSNSSDVVISEMTATITISDILQIVNEIHQYSTTLIQLSNRSTFGVSCSSSGQVTYFKAEKWLLQNERRNLAQKISAGDLSTVRPLSIEQFLRETEGKKTRHIWLETPECKRKELAFASLSELKAFFRGNSHKQHTTC